MSLKRKELEVLKLIDSGKTVDEILFQIETSERNLRYIMDNLNFYLKKILDKDPNAVQDFFYKKETIKEEDGSSSFKETGITQKLGSFVNGYINAKTGVIASKSTSLDLSIKDMDKQIERFTERLETKRQQYIKQFTALDTAMMQAESQMEYLVGQVNSMTGKGN